VAATKVVDRGVVLPFTVHTALLLITPAPSKFEPVMVNVRSGLPATALVGEIELIEAGPDEAVTGNATEIDFKKGTSPIGSPVCTNTCAVVGLVNRAAGSTAASCVLLSKVVAKRVLIPFTDHTA
jgi:hypothetical protein